MRSRTAIVLAASALALVACAKKKPAIDAVGISDGSNRPLLAATKKRVLARPLVTLNGSTLGPYLAHQGEGYLIAYVSSTESELVAMPLLADGAPSGSAKILGRVPPETNAMVLRPLGRSGYALLLKRPNERGETLEVVGVQNDGSPFGKLATLTVSQGRVVWFDVLRTGAASVAVWAEDNDSGDVTLFSQPLEGNGKPSSVPMRVGKRAVAWSATHGANGAALAWIARESALIAEGPLLVQRFDKQGQLEATPLTVTPKALAGSEIEMVYSKGAYVLGWTDATVNPTQALVASVQEDGTIEAPRPLMRRAKSSDLARLVASPQGWVAAWRDGLGTTGSLQGRLMVGALAGEPTSILHVAPKAPVFGSLLERGSAWLLTARPCAGTELSCDAAYEPELHVLEGSEHRVIRLENESNQAFALTWDLHCDAKQCMHLAASPGNPTTVFSVTTSLADRGESKVKPPEPALASVVVAEAQGGPVALASSNGLVGMLSETRTPNRFELQVIPLGDDLEPPKAIPAALTSVGVLSGGVAMAPGPKDDGAIVGWVADDNNVEHVHLARVDKAGQRKNHVLLTQQKGDKWSVCIARIGAQAGDKRSAGDGYFVAWIDERASEPQVYATRVTADLARVARETKLTNAPGDKSELGCAVVEDRVVLTWVDTRDDLSHTRGDIFTMNVRPRDVAALAPERAVLATAPRSYSPLLRVRNGKEAVVTWIEAGSTASESYVFETSLVGAAGAPTRRRIPGAAVALVAGATTDRIAALVSEGRKLSLFDDPGGTQPGGNANDLRRVGWLLDSPAGGAPAVIAGTRLLFGESGSQPALRAFALP